MLKQRNKIKEATHRKSAAVISTLLDLLFFSSVRGTEFPNPQEKGRHGASSSSSPRERRTLCPESPGERSVLLQGRSGGHLARKSYKNHVGGVGDRLIT